VATFAGAGAGEDMSVARSTLHVLLLGL